MAHLALNSKLNSIVQVATIGANFACILFLAPYLYWERRGDKKFDKMAEPSRSSEPGHARRTDHRRHPALPGRFARGQHHRADRSRPLGTGGWPLTHAVHQVPVQELPAARTATRKPRDGRTARRRGGRADHSPADDPSPNGPPVLRAGQPAHALAAQ